MLDRIILFSLKNKLVVLLSALSLIIGGLYTAGELDIDVFPDLTAPTVIVMTDAHGMAAEEVERLVTFPIETAMNGARGVRRVRSNSSMGFSFVWIEFDWGTDIYKARQVVSEKLVTIATEIPIGVSQPVLAPQSSVMGEILFISLQSDSTDMSRLRTLAEWNLKPALLATGGVSQVTIIGGNLKQYQVLANPDRMLHYEVSIDELAEVCRNASRNSTGGVLREYGNEYTIRGVGRTHNLKELANTYVKMHKGQPVVVGDVAEVKIGSAQKMGHASQNAKPAIIISISKQPGVNTLQLTEKIEASLTELQKTLPPDIRINTKVFRQADFIEKSVGNVSRALLEGALFVVVVLFLFLASFRTTLISVIAIPLSLLVTVLVFKLFNMTINTMSLGGMTIAIGSLVDDAIIDVENVFKRLRENFRLEKGKRLSTFKVVFEASSEIRSSILNATLIIIVAFIPLFFLSGMEGRMLKPLGIAYIVSLFASLIVALTITPQLCNLLLTSDRYLQRNSKEGWLVRNLFAQYRKMLKWSLAHRKTILIPTTLLLLAALLAASQMGSSFLPQFNEGALTISAISQPGISLEESNRLGQRIEKELLAIPEVNSTARRTGRGELDPHSQMTNSAEIDVSYTLKDRDNQEFLKEVRQRLAHIPGIAFTVGQPLGHRIDHMISGTRANIAVKIFGPDLQQLYSIGKKIQSAISDIEGLVDVNVAQQVEIPQIQIKARRELLARYGIPMERFHHYIEMAFAGEKMADIYEGQQSFDFILRLTPEHTQSLDGIKNALITTDDGRKVPLLQVAEIVSASGPNAISRENVQRKLVVSANVTEGDLVGTVKKVKQTINNEIMLPQGYRIEYGGQFENQARASNILLLTSLAALLIIFILLYQEFRNGITAAIILLNLPLSLIGGIFTLYFTTEIVSIPAIIGFITLFGIATRNGILLVSRFRLLQAEGLPLSEVLIKGSVDRLNPILMTALTAALALIPLALNGDATGNEIQSPMAKVILGGLLSSTLLNIFIIPIVYQMIEGSPRLSNFTQMNKNEDNNQ